MYRCPHCSFTSMNRKALNMHMEEKHAEQRKQRGKSQDGRNIRSTQSVVMEVAEKPRTKPKQRKERFTCFQCLYFSNYDSEFKYEIVRGM